jgi:lipoprotein-anchoring transpeptidase ErfK/SrfK
MQFRVSAVTSPVLRILALLALSILAACAAPKAEEPQLPVITPGYEAVEDEGFFIEAVEPQHLAGGQARVEVDYAGDEKPGTIVVDTFARRLYFVLEGNRAIRYAIAVGREGLAFRGSGVIGRKEKWPSWQPTANMLRTRPDLYAEYAGGRAGGLDNPLGARAMYLYRGGRDSMFRIHGTIQNSSIGHATSAGCIRLFNQDAMDLFERVEMGARVKVRSLEESLEAEGPYMEDAYGRAVPDTPVNVAKKAADLIAIAEEEARRVQQEAIAAEQAALEFEKAEKKRLAKCRRQGITPADCPPAPQTVLAGISQ